MTARLTAEPLEARECPAMFKSFVGGHLRITFNNDSTTAQSVVVSSVNGLVTLNEARTNIRASAVTRITVVGSGLDNRLDLHFVSTGTGFRNLNGKVVVKGGGGNDVLYATQFGTRLEGGAGFDQLFGAGGADTLDGGAGDDWVYPWLGADTIVTGNGNDWVDRLEPIDVTRPA